MKRYKVNKKRLARAICVVAATAVLLGLAVDFGKYPECYITTLRYQLQNDINRGNEEMIDYYNRNYVANGRELFE